MAFNKTELQEFVRYLAALASSFGREADEPTCMAYEIGLSDLPLEACRQAMMRAMRECKFMPSPAELRELAGVVTAKSRVVLAWDAFDSAVQRHGYYDSVSFDDPVLNATIRNLGGWQRVCDLPAEQYETFFRKEFDRVYLALLQTGVTPEQGAPLLGFYATQNSGNGQPIAEPVLIETGLPDVPRLTHERERKLLTASER